MMINWETLHCLSCTLCHYTMHQTWKMSQAPQACVSKNFRVWSNVRSEYRLFCHQCVFVFALFLVQFFWKKSDFIRINRVRWVIVGIILGKMRWKNEVTKWGDNRVVIPLTQIPHMGDKDTDTDKFSCLIGGPTF